MNRIIKITAFLIVFTAIAIVFITQKENFDTKKNSMPKAYSANKLHEIEAEYKKNLRKKGYAKSDKPNGFMRHFETISKQIGESQSNYPLNYQFEEYEKALKSRPKKRGEQLEWVQRGPGNVAGRVRCILVDPDDWQHETWYIGSASGGIWKTTDAGYTWENLTPNLPNLATNTLATSDANTNIIYAGTGEGFGGYGMIEGAGIFVSDNKGETWQQLTKTAGNPDFRWVFRIAVSPNDENIVVAATNAGIMRTTDGGLSWDKVYQSDYRVEDLKADPTNFNTMYAAENSYGILKSEDAGQTWIYSSDGMGQLGRRYELAVSPVSGNYVYCSVEVNEYLSYVYVSKNKAQSWARFNSDINFMEGQGWFDNTIAGHPFDKDIAYVGGVNIWQVNFEGSIVDGHKEVIATDTTNTTFLDFINFGGEHFGGGMDLGNNNDAVDLENDDFVSVEIRFGADKKQMAHRFIVPPNSGMNNNGGPGVEAKNYIYQDFVEIPFEVWDITNNRQLVVSFRDQERDGTFNLIHRDPDDEVPGREYIFVHAIEYNPENENQNIAENGGHAYKQIYFFWPTLAAEAIWTPDDLPESKISVEYGAIRIQNGTVQNITDAYGMHSGRNRYISSNRVGSSFIPGVHPDHHHLVLIPLSDNEFITLCANDGGLAVSNNELNTWRQISNGITNTQFYGVAKKPGALEFIGGMQDNGTWRSPENTDATSTSNYVYQITGDGFEAVWHATNPQKILGSNYYNDIYATNNGGKTWESVGQTIGGTSPFITRLSTSKTNPNMVFAVSSSGVWSSNNFGEQWKLTTLENTDGWELKGSIESNHIVRVSLANEQIIWAGQGMAEFPSGSLRLFVSRNEGFSFEPTNNFDNDILKANISGLATHPYDDNVAYALFSAKGKPKILRTQNLGESWEDISGFGSNETSSNGFPDVQVYSLLVMPHNPKIIWAGTNIGIVESTDNGENWALADNGFPAVSVWDMKAEDNQIIIATHGRGIWTVEEPELLKGEPNNYLTPPGILSFSQNLNKKLVMDIHRRTIYDSLQVWVNQEKNITIQNNEAMDTVNIITNEVQSGNTTFRVIGYRDNLIAESISWNIDVWQLNEPTENFRFTVTENSSDFEGEGFEVALKEGFNDYAIHSVHPYYNASNLTYLIRTPIILTSHNSLFEYKDVTLVQNGWVISEFGDEEFFDYVIVEGTIDGTNWIALTDGYDASFSQIWQSPYNFRIDGTEELFVEHSIDLLQTFNEGDTVLLRFRLYADNDINGWGWAIAGKNYIADIEQNNLSADSNMNIYPNPAKNHIYIENHALAFQLAQINIFDMNGRLMKTESIYFTSKHARLNLNRLKSGYYIIVIKIFDKIYMQKISVTN